MCVFQTWKWARWCLFSLMWRGSAHAEPKSSRARRCFWVTGFLRWIALRYSAQMDLGSESSSLYKTLCTLLKARIAVITRLSVCLSLSLRGVAIRMTEPLYQSPSFDGVLTDQLFLQVPCFCVSDNCHANECISRVCSYIV